ncbi:MAG: serine/threonine-protein kinase [bacterium]
MSTISGEILFEKFEILDVLKKDEHTGVFLANHIYLGKKIILKALNTQTILDDAKIERFKREAKVLAKLDHPNIIKVLDFGTYQEYFYISFEYFKSDNLRTFIKNNNITEEQKENIEIQILKGLAYSHNNNIIHRDLKPENILINHLHQVKVSDFGLALEVDDTFVTRQYSIVGTPCYMSPEQLKGEKLTLQSDLFSLGIVLFELFTGINPFLGKDINQSINNIINYKEENISDKINTLSETQREIVKKLLKKNKSDRFTSVDEILALLNVSPDEKIPIPSSEKKKWNKSLITASIFFIIVIVSAIFIFTQNNAIPNPNDDHKLKKEEIDSPVLSTEQNKNNIVKNDEEEVKPEDLTTKETGLTTEQQMENTQNNIDIPLPGKGSLYIECIPWAYIYLDSVKVETTPLENPLEISSGTHHLRLIHPDFPNFETKVSIQSNRTTNIKVNLDTLFGYYNCKIYPWAEIYIDGKYISQSPLRNPVKLFPGKHEITLKNPKYNSISDLIVVSKRDTVIKQYRFENPK